MLPTGLLSISNLTTSTGQPNKSFSPNVSAKISINLVLTNKKSYFCGK
jgi:hypothetical protein